MFNRSSFFLLVCFTVFSSHLFAAGNAEQTPASETVKVYTYDSFASDWGAGPEIARRFTEQTGYRLEYIVCEDSAAILSKAIIEKDRPQGDVLLGIDNFMVQRAADAGVLTPYRSPRLTEKMEKAFGITKNHLLTPYDWGFFALMYDSNASVPAPKSLEDLTKPEYKQSLVIMDPTMSSPGLGFAAWTRAVYGDAYTDYWKRLKPSLLSMSHSWSAGYGLFTAGEAPLVTSYTTSMAYHLINDKTSRYQALSFPEGHIITIEGMGIVKNAPNKRGAQAFIDFMLSESAQSVLPETQWMYPVLDTIPLPEAFKHVPVPQKPLRISAEKAQETAQSVLYILKN